MAKTFGRSNCSETSNDARWPSSACIALQPFGDIVGADGDGSSYSALRALLNFSRLTVGAGDSFKEMVH
jgi:hypothetical protein